MYFYATRGTLFRPFTLALSANTRPSSNSALEVRQLVVPRARFHRESIRAQVFPVGWRVLNAHLANDTSVYGIL